MHEKPYLVNQYLIKTLKMYQDVAIIIPARLASTRLPRKMLLPIGNLALIEHTYQRALEADVGTVYVATDSAEIGALIENMGGRYIMTREDCAKGSDRVHEALQFIPHRNEIKYVVNIQGDMPVLDPRVIRQVIEYLKSSNFDIVTPVTRVGIDVASSSGNVKVVVDRHNRALYFSRGMIPHGASEWFYHIGIYGFRIEALEKFVALPES